MFAFLRCFLACMVLLPASAPAVSLLNGSVFSVNGLNLTVSSCSLTLASVTQSSCAAGHIAIQALNTASGASYKIIGDGTGSNGSNIFSTPDGRGLFEIAFTLTITPTVNGAATTVSSAALSMTGSGYDLCDLTHITTDQQFSAAAGSTHLATNLANHPSASGTFAPVHSFSINSKLSVHADGYPYGTLKLSSVTETFNPAPEPGGLIMLLTGLAGLALARRHRLQAQSSTAGGEMGGIRLR